MDYELDDILFQEDLKEGVKKSILLGKKGHLLISGPAGCGQAIAARLIAKNINANKKVKTMLPYEVISSSQQESLKQLKREINSATGGVLYIPKFEDFFLEENAKSILEYLLVSLKSENYTLVISTDAEGFRRIQSFSPELYRYFIPVRVRNFTVKELDAILKQIVKKDGNKINKSDLDEAFLLMRKIRSSGNLKNGRVPRALYINSLNKSIFRKHNYIHIEDIADAVKDFNGINLNGYQQLDNLIGLSDVKKVVKLWLANYAIYSKRESLGINTSGMSQHMVFMGPPGTAKTTVARIIGSILAENGVLSSGHVVETSRTDLVGASSESTFKKISEAVRRAIGGVLFIDEAYNLATGHGNEDYGKDAVEALLKYMEDFRDEFVVVVAGYGREMDKFLSSNPGLRSRFAKKLEFPGYTMDELIEILNFQANERGFMIDPKVFEHVKVDLKVAINYPSFGNGRYIRDMLEEAISKQATRLDIEMDDSEFLTLKVEDFQKDVPGIKISLV